MKTLQKLNFPEFELKIKNDVGQTFVFDSIRKKWLVLTPEEWVRQHLIHYLVSYKNYPPALISLEAGLKYHTLAKRTDVLVYDKNARPYLLVECKSAEVIINQKVVEQVSMYNKSVEAPFLCVTNGIKHYCWAVHNASGNFEMLNQIPEFGS